MNLKKLTQEAIHAKEFSYSPYSNFRVGAAILGASGKMYRGCNIENSSFSLTICAERAAIFSAISAGETQFKAIAIASDSNSAIPPCGACRQVLLELAGNVRIVLCNAKGRMTKTELTSLLPRPFTQKYLRK